MAFFIKTFRIITRPYSNPVFKWIMGTTLVFGLILLAWMMSIPPLIIWPSTDQYSFCFFADTANQGNSQILKHTIKDSTIDLKYILRKGFIDPYVSIHIQPVSGRWMNLKCYNRLILDMEGINCDNIGFDLLASGSTEGSSNKIYMTDSYVNIIHLDALRKSYILPFHDLKIPDYWYVNHNLDPGLRIRPNLSMVSGFNIGTAYPTHLNTVQQFRIHSIRFERDNRLYLIFILGAELFIFIVLTASFHVRAYFLHQRKKLIITYQPVTSSGIRSGSAVESCMDYISSHFQDPELSLEQIAKHFGVNQRIITRTVKEVSGFNFKNYLNHLRIHEAKRLLLETELNMSEVAYKSGFNTPSHFNRVFKTLIGINPTTFKNSDNQ